MGRPLCAPEEDVLRAICSNEWDEAARRPSSSLFRGPSTSLSRLKFGPLEHHWNLFEQYVQKPTRELLYVGEIKIQKMIDLGKESNAEITVEEDPVHWNPAHAEIPQKLPRGLSLKIIDSLKLHGGR